MTKYIVSANPDLEFEIRLLLKNKSYVSFKLLLAITHCEINYLIITKESYNNAMFMSIRAKSEDVEEVQRLYTKFTASR
jgi:hypothetical protein